MIKQFDRTLKKVGNKFNNLDGDGSTDNPFILLKNALTYAFSIATLSTTGSEEVKVNKYFGNFSATMRPLKNKYQNLPSHFDKTDKPQNGFKGSSLKKVLIAFHK